MHVHVTSCASRWQTKRTEPILRRQNKTRKRRRTWTSSKKKRRDQVPQSLTIAMADRINMVCSQKRIKNNKGTVQRRSYKLVEWSHYWHSWRDFFWVGQSFLLTDRSSAECQKSFNKQYCHAWAYQYFWKTTKTYPSRYFEYAYRCHMLTRSKIIQTTLIFIQQSHKVYTTKHCMVLTCHDWAVKQDISRQNLKLRNWQKFQS